MSEQWNTDLFRFLVWLGERESPRFSRKVTQYADQYREEHPLKKANEILDPDELQLMDECDKEWVEGWKKQVQKSKLNKSEQDYVEATDDLVWPKKPRIDKMLHRSKPKANEK